MKENYQNKKYVYYTFFLMIAVTLVLFAYVKFIQKNTEERCFTVMEDLREQIGASIVNDMVGEQEHLEGTASLIGELIGNFDENKMVIYKIMNASSSDRNYSTWELCLPSCHVMNSDGIEYEIGEYIDFQSYVKNSVSVTEKKKDVKDGMTDVILISKCIFNKGECIGILSSKIDLEFFEKSIMKKIKADRYGLLLFQRGTGDILFDTTKTTLGNVFSDRKDGKSDYINWEEIKADFLTGTPGTAAYYARHYKEKVYVSYSSIPFSDWELFVSSPESFVMTTANKNKRVTRYMMSAILILASIFVMLVVVEERHRRKIKAEEAEILRDALNRAQVASEAKSTFLFNMSHDLRTPLNAIIGFTNLLEKNIDNKTVALNYLGKIQSSNAFLLSLVNNVLEMARIESGKATLEETYENSEVVMNAVVATFEDQFAKKGVEFKYTFDVQHKVVFCDGTKIKEIFLNLLSNALKFTPSGGKVTFSVVETPSESKDSAVFKAIIEDTGIGMSKEYLPRLFDKFDREHNTTQSKVSGTGLGMPIVKHLIDIMDGTIDVESELGKGTKYTVYIPHRIPNAEEVHQLKEAARTFTANDFKGKRILLAEDNEMNAEIASTILEEAGFEVERASDGVECVDIYTRAEYAYYDIILMDIQMPNMDGYKATHAIRHMEDEKKSKIPIIAMTANAFEEDRQNAFRAGMNDHISKPIDVQLLLGTINRLIN